MNAKDWTLLVLGAASGETLSPVQLQKSLFLLSRNLRADQLGTDSFYEFEPYDYGPFSAQVYSDAEALGLNGLVSIEYPDGSRFRLYRATDGGIKEAENLQSMLGDDVCSYLQRLVGWVKNLSFKQLVNAIYEAYPEMRENSIFRG